MDICIDVQAAIAQRAGVGRYTQLLVQHLDRLAADHRLRLFFFDFHRRGLPFPVQRATSQPMTWCPGRLAQSAWKHVQWPPFDAFSGPADLFHFPNFIAPPLRRGKAVVTIHDMSFLRHPEFTEDRNRQYLLKRIDDTARRAACILTVSRFSASEIAETLHVPADRIRAVHLGIAPEFHRPPHDVIARALTSLGLDRPYLLTVGTVEPRKNLPFLIELFERLPAFDGRLVIAGRLGWKFGPILERIKRSPRAADILLLQHVEDNALPALYAGAELFLITSFYEGFGFPPLEAMACGTPVLASRGGSLPEILGDGALSLAGFDVAEWANAAERLLHETDLRRRQTARGLTQAARYDWDRTARETLAAYEQTRGAA
ncbi:MAG: glycosyltransferase family 4 protein [Lentisphaerae bacterium]|nr:glycosyltransferase family 4 protein [Lentisphaerota bacterium]